MHGSTDALTGLLVLIAAAVLFVPLARLLGLGSILGYLAAGAVIGPWSLGLVSDVETVRHVAEFGVVFLLFLIGIEMKPRRLWTMRRQVFGMGGVQVLLTGGLLALAGWLAGLPTASAVIVGLGLALSSTAMGLQVLAERRELNSTAGRATFSILLLQDLSVPVLLTLVPLLGRDAQHLTGDLGLAVLEGAGIVAAAMIGGRLLMRPLLRLVAGARTAEVFTAFALLVVLGMAWVMDLAGLSMALGAFLAGLLLADSEFRHQVEADIQPFRGLLLGLFFMGVGMGIDFGLLAADGPRILAMVGGLMGVKAAVVLAVARLFGLTVPEAVKSAGLLAQSGEFAFVLFTYAVAEGVLEETVAQPLVLAISLSMALTPAVVALAARLAGRLGTAGAPRGADDDAVGLPEDGDGHVIIAGFGRVGQTVAAMLRAAGRPYVAFDLDLDKVREGRERDFQVYYGDASRPEVLRAARAETARVAVVTMDDAAVVARTVARIRLQHPGLAVHARARDLAHAHALKGAGATASVPETLEASLYLGRSTLTACGVTAEEARAIVWSFRDNDYATLAEAVTRTR
jgi:monovalent cation:proton antiporter-2 (CPA2) family protein